jgi:chromosome segregation ATPase
MLFAPAPTADQESHVGRLLEQLNFYWVKSEDLRYHTGALQMQLDSLQRERARLHHDYITECHEHAQTVAQLAQLREQFQHLNNLLSSEGKDPQATISVFLELESRTKSLQQAELEICQRAGALRTTCQGIEDRYSGVRQKQSNLSNQGLRFHYPRQNRPCGPIGARPAPKETAPARGK